MLKTPKPRPVFKATGLSSRKKTRFALGQSDHIAGVVNPPNAGKYGFWPGGLKAQKALKSDLPERCGKNAHVSMIGGGPTGKSQCASPVLTSSR